ncbi:hypothetical protein DRN93_05755 [archaeon]|nr:MAG: hypothetical protein DRN93_05755 [archaeon]
MEGKMKGEDLLDRIVSGDQSAFKELVRKYRHTVFLSALSILHDPNEAEEIAQEVFLKVHLHLSGLRDQNAFERWLRSITCNLAINRLKRRVRRSCIPLDEVASEDLLSPPADEELLRKEMVEEVMRAMDELPEGEREILREHLLEGKGYRELSEKYGLSYHAVVMRVKRAKEKVREKVLRRLSCVVMGPWREIIEVIGGVVMKVTTKVAITGAVVMMLTGAGIWMSHRGEEKPMPKADEVKVERQATVEAPARVVGRPEKKEKDDFTFEEFNRLLDELFNQALQDKGGEGSSREANGRKVELKDNMVSSSNTEENVTSPPEGEEVKGKTGDDELSELIQKILDLAAEHQALLEEYRALSDEYEVCKDPVRKHEIYLEWDKLGQKLDDLEWKAKFLFVEYHLRTGDTAAFEPGGWIDSLGVLKAAKIERDADGVWHVQWLPGKYLH